MRKLHLKILTLGIVLFFACLLNLDLVLAQRGDTNTTGTSGSGVTNTTKPVTSTNANSVNPDYTNINSSKFRLLICDGPAELAHFNPGTGKIDPAFTDANFVPCDFRGLMMQVQHLINIALIVGVLLAIVGFIRAGYLYITGVPGNISKAHEIFPSVAWGFIIMLSAWFIVYQILEWLTGSRGFGVLLGS